MAQLYMGRVQISPKEGVYVEYGTSAEEGKEFDLMFELLIKGVFKRVMVKGRVVRSIMIAGRGVYGLAFVFKGFEKETDKVLKEYIEHRRTSTY